MNGCLFKAAAKFEVFDSRAPKKVPGLVNIYLSDYDVYVLNLYRAPSYMQSDNDFLLRFLYHFGSKNEVIVLGDFNFPSVQWGLKYALAALSVFDNQFVDMFYAIGLAQMVQIPLNLLLKMSWILYCVLKKTGGYG